MADETRDDQPEQAPEGETPSAGEQVKALREDLSPAKLNAKLEEVIEERPKTAHLLDFKIVGQALLAAAVVALILWLLIGPKIAALALVVVFLGVWLIGAQMSYDRRRQTRDVRKGDGDGDGDGGDGGSGSDAGSEEEDAPARQAEARTT
jgi:Flp pilus assembly protein TadB